MLSIKNLRVKINDKQTVYALRGIDLELSKGEIVSLVGESGSGKSMLTKAIMGLLPVKSLLTGSIVYKGQDLTSLNERELSNVRGREIGIVLQNPNSVLNPTIKVGKQIVEAILIHQKISKKAAFDKAMELLDLVRLEPYVFDKYPFELSGGQNQRIAIAIAIANDVDLLILDEATSSLDVTVQSQIIELLLEIKNKRDLTILFITHDLNLSRMISDRIMVMYAGKIIEYGLVNEIFLDAKHPYTWELLASNDKYHNIIGDPVNLTELIKGDAFAPRNKFVLEIDHLEHPPFFKVSDTHYAATWLLHKDAPEVTNPYKKDT
jgi:oligopeptide transport system ATP-binding protein